VEVQEVRKIDAYLSAGFGNPRFRVVRGREGRLGRCGLYRERNHRRAVRDVKTNDRSFQFKDGRVRRGRSGRGKVRVGSAAAADICRTPIPSSRYPSSRCSCRRQAVHPNWATSRHCASPVLGKRERSDSRRSMRVVSTSRGVAASRRQPCVRFGGCVSAKNRSSQPLGRAAVETAPASSIHRQRSRGSAQR